MPDVGVEVRLLSAGPPVSVSLPHCRPNSLLGGSGRVLDHLLVGAPPGRARSAFRPSSIWIPPGYSGTGGGGDPGGSGASSGQVSRSDDPERPGAKAWDPAGRAAPAGRVCLGAAAEPGGCGDITERVTVIT